MLAAGSFNLVRPACNPKGLAKLEHLSFGGGFANKGLHLLFPLLKLKSLYVQGIDSVTDCVMRHISCSQKQLQHLSLRRCGPRECSACICASSVLLVAGSMRRCLDEHAAGSLQENAQQLWHCLDFFFLLPCPAH